MEYRNINDLKNLKNNPRIIKDEKFKILCESIKNNKDFFEARPIILSDRTGELVVIAGNQRLKASKYLKLKQVPTFLIQGLTEEKEKEIIIRDNVELGEFDFDILANEYNQEDLSEWGLDIEEIENQDTEDNIDKEINDISTKKITISFLYLNSKQVIDTFLKEIMNNHPELINMVEISD